MHFFFFLLRINLDSVTGAVDVENTALRTESSSACSPSLRYPLIWQGAVRDTCRQVRLSSSSSSSSRGFESDRAVLGYSASPCEKAQKVSLGKNSIKKCPFRST